MTNKLIYTFHRAIAEEFYRGVDKDTKIVAYIHFYQVSINNAVKLGYDCELYCDVHTSQLFSGYEASKKLKINIIDIDIEGMFDNVKSYVYTKRDDDFILIDGDCFLMKRLPEIKSDVLVETHEPIYDIAYKDTVEYLNSINVNKVVKEWVGNPRKTIVNTGLLYIKNKKIKDIYVKRCFDLQKYIMDKVNYSDYYDLNLKFHATCAQYLLSEIIDYYDLKCLSFESGTKPNTYYHLKGSDKFKLSDFTRYNLKEKTIL